MAEPMTDERLRQVKYGLDRVGDWFALNADDAAALLERLAVAEGAGPREVEPHGDQPPAWIDRHGDVWIFPGGGDTGYSFETQPFSRAHIERKWGPLAPLVRQS